MAYVCITGSEKNPQDLVARVAKVLEANSRLICELRLDYLELTPSASFAFLEKLPPEWAPRLVITMRLQASGPIGNGRCKWDLQTWQSWWIDVMALRPWFAVDLDWIILDELAGESLNWRGKFRSRHAFFSVHVPLDEVAHLLPELESSARQHNAGLKIATPVQGARDLAYLARLTQKIDGHPLKIIAAIGDAGKAWRWSRLTGNLSYFSYTADGKTASGQDLFENVLPYSYGAPIPELYILWSEDPDNHFGEREWNRLFLQRGTNARFINVACKDAPLGRAPVEEKKIWAHCALDWMEMANVRGAAITKPFKEFFALAMAHSGHRSINTIYREQGKWMVANTDGGGVSNLLQRYQRKKVIVIGGGGAGKGVSDALRTDDFEVQNILRDQDGQLPHLPKGDCLISTWPLEYQDVLVQALSSQHYQTQLLLDAQLKEANGKAPLARWAREKNIPYLSGRHWWHAQAKIQDEIWFPLERRNKFREKILPLLPNSKSETLRALAIAAFYPGKTIIQNPALCQDTELFLHALEQLGLHFEREESGWVVNGSHKLKSNGDPIFIGEGAAPLRFLAALSMAIAGKALRIDAAPSLRKRPVEEIFRAFGLGFSNSWPLEIPCQLPMPTEVSVAESSQFASGFLLAAAALLWQEKTNEVRLRFVGELRSESYLLLTKRMLEESGVAIHCEGQEWRLCLGGAPATQQTIKIEKDATAIANFELLAIFENLGSLQADRIAKLGEQGDWRFLSLLTEFFATDHPLSLRDVPDLAPVFFVASLLYRKRLLVKDAPQLHAKECDRAKAIVNMARELGVDAEEHEDGFLVDGRSFKPPANNMLLTTNGDHRMAMAAGILSLVFPSVKADNEACVAKSFPGFWIALKKAKGLIQ